MFTWRTERLIDVPPNVAWAVISDIEAYAHYAPNLSKAVAISDEPGANRRCYDTQGRGWNEECVLWKEGEVYSYQVDTSDYPYPFTQMQGTWGLERRPLGTLVYMQFDFTPKTPPFMGWLVNRVVRKKFAPVVEQLMDNWEAEMLARKTQRNVA